LLNEFTEKVYPELDLAFLFAEHKKKEELANAEAQKARDAAIAAKE